ncbi:MAG: hypothetical protein Q9162_005155 [Coniocarpon cinnabarinum]
MDTIRSMIFKPTPEEQKRKCSSLIRSNTRKLDRDIQQLRLTDNKTKNLILQANKRGQRDPARQKQAAQETRIFAKELVRIRKQNARLQTSKAQLESVGMQVNEAFSVRKIEGSLKASTGIMKDVNTLVKLPEIAGTMRELSQELMKAGIIEEMVDETLTNGEMEDGEEEGEEEVEKVLKQILEPKEPERKVSTPAVETPQQPEEVPEVPVGAERVSEDEEDQEAILMQMRGRLEALKS